MLRKGGIVLATIAGTAAMAVADMQGPMYPPPNGCTLTIIGVTDTTTVTYDITWAGTVTGNIVDDTVALPAIDSMDSISIEISHSRAEDIIFTVTAPNGDVFALTKNPAGANDLGVGNDYTLGGVAIYAFESTGPLLSSISDDPIPAGTYGAEAWPSGGYAAGVWRITLVDGSSVDGGAVGDISLNYTIQGPAGRAGGLVYEFTGLDPIDLASGLYYGRHPDVPVQLSLDGSDFTGPETMSFAGMTGNVATWLGQSSLWYPDGSGWTEAVVDTRFTLTATDLFAAPVFFISPASVGIQAEADAVLVVPGDFRVTLLFEADFSGWEPAYDLFDRIENRPGDAVAYNVGTAYWASVCLCEWDGTAGVDVFDLLGYLNDWFPAAAAADIDGTTGVDVFDLLTYLDCWFIASSGTCP